MLAKGDAFLTQLLCSFQSGEQLFFIMDFEWNGTLHDVMKQNISFNDKVFYLASLSIALKHLHRINVIHRDLTMSNAFIGKDGHIVLGDYGCSAYYVKYVMVTEVAGTLSTWVSVHKFVQ